METTHTNWMDENSKGITSKEDTDVFKMINESEC